MYAVEASLRISGITAIKTRYRCRQPGWRRGAGVLHQFGIGRMLKCPLAFAIVIEMEFVHRAVAERPGVSDIPLLGALRHDTSEAGEIGPRQFEICERVLRTVVIEIVIDTQVLLIIQPVVNSSGHLVAANSSGGDGADQRTAVWRSGNKLKKINRGGVHAREWNLTLWEQLGVIDASRNASRITDSLVASWTVVEKLWIVQQGVAGILSVKTANIGKVRVGLGRAWPLRRTRHADSRRKDALPDASTFVASEEERAALYNGAAKSATKLALIRLGLIAGKTFRSRKAVIIGVENLVSEELVGTAMPLICP